MSTETTRAVEKEIEIKAPVDAVWRALTDAEELKRWFPLDAKVTPGVGGSIWLHWDEVYDAEGAIEVWEPGKHLRFGFPEEGAEHLVTDYYLQTSDGGGTVLRVVTSGFGTGGKWDDMFDGVRCGWDFELRGLQHYLENHPGKDRAVAWATAKHTSGHEAAWSSLMGQGGWFAGGRMMNPKVGERYTVRTGSGDELSGVIHVWEPPRQFVGSVDGWNNAIMRVELYGGNVTVWLSAYGVPEADVRALGERWQREMEGEQ